MDFAARPVSLRNLRACRTCKLVKTLAQFEQAMCDNCAGEWADGERIEKVSDARRKLMAEDNTTADFVGHVAMMRPEDSWVARWLKMHTSAGGAAEARASFKPGLYAISLPVEEDIRAQEQAAVREGEAGDGGDKEGALDEADEDDKDFIASDGEVEAETKGVAADGKAKKAKDEVEDGAKGAKAAGGEEAGSESSSGDDDDDEEDDDEEDDEEEEEDDDNDDDDDDGEGGEGAEKGKAPKPKRERKE
jgi:hypothetical protein